jgi:flagellar biosynthesis/type III secretory pathway protein FliH
MQESDRKAPSDMAVLRQPQQGLGTRRLPGLSGLHGGAVAPVAEPAARSHTLDSLSSAFASELALLADEARQEGLATARQVASKALAEQQQEQSRQWQKKESALRLALEQEQQRMSALAEALARQSEKAVEAMQPVVGRLALAVVTRVLGQHLVSRPLVADLAAQAVEQYRLGNPLRIRVSAADYASLSASAGEEGPLACFQVDHEAAVGSCVIDFGAGQLDAGLETQLAAIKQALLPDSQGDDRVAPA